MIYIFLLIFFSINMLPNHAQELNFVKNQIVIQDAVGDIQTRFLNSHIWTPVTAGITISQNSFIRLNSPSSAISIAYPDGSMVRLIGVGSFFFENISELVNNAYQSKMLVLFGRWSYQSHPDYQSRFIVNTDITTSIVENGIGAGFFSNGTNEFVLKKGRGLISYRQQNAKAIVLDEQQYVKFNILDGFFFPKLATEELFKQYLIFSEEKTTTNQTNTKDLGTLSLLSYTNDLTNTVSQKKIVSEEIDIQQLDSLKNLNFRKRSDFLQVTIAKIEKIPKSVPVAAPVNPLLIPQSLLTAIDIEDFEIASKPAEEEVTNVTPKPIRRARPVKPAVRPKTRVKKKPVVTKAKPKVIAPKNDVDDLLKSLDQSFAEEIELEVPSTPAPAKTNAENSGIVIEEIAPPVVEPIELIELEVEPEPQEPLVIEEKTPRKRVPRRRVPKETEAEIAERLEEERLEEEEEARYKASEAYWNRNLNNDQYRYNQFEFQNTDDIMDSFSSVLFN